MGSAQIYPPREARGAGVELAPRETEEPPSSSLLTPGSTCWKVARASRFSMVQDAGPCFEYIADAIDTARRSVFILGWDVDSRTVLRPDATDASARSLLPLLLRALGREPTLHIFLLTWDFSFVYTFEREPAPLRQFGKAHSRLHFALDADHGSGGSHHQKVVVVDDRVAFVGGIDLTFHRWDTPAHAVVDPRRLDDDGNPYGPFHDVHTVLEGPAARALGALARDRWNSRRRPRTPPLAPAEDGDGWPKNLPVDVRDVDVGIARTLTRPSMPSVREIEALTLRSIAAARKYIYAENQYLTSQSIVRAFGDQLARPDGPEVILVLPRSESGWMEQSSMGLLREEALGHLRAADRGGRLRLLTPVVSDANGSAVVAVHSKVLVIDDRLAKIGSANFSNRSLGLDSECDLAIEATDAGGPAARFVASVRNRLLAEHLGLSPETVATQLINTGSLRQLVDRNAAGGSYARALVPVPETCEAPVDLTLFEGAIVDPPEPWNASMLLKRAVPTRLRTRLARHWLRPILLCLAMLGIWTVVRHVAPGRIRLHGAFAFWAVWFAERPGGALGAGLAIAVAGMLFVPITLLATAALAVFGLWPGVPVAWLGATLSALGSHAIGQGLRSRPAATRILAWRRLAGLQHFLGRRGFWSVVLMRMLPLGNFGALNLLTGILGVPRRAFLFGNLVGLLPGLLGLGLFVNRALAALKRPTAVNIAVAIFIVGLSGASAIALKRKIQRDATASRDPR